MVPPGPPDPAYRPEGPQLARRLDLTDAVVLGLASMVGAGVFAAFTPAAEAAGSALLVGLALAAAVAWANATSSAQLAAQYPTAGGTYVYGRERLGAAWGFLAGWGFVVGKTASCAAMALTVATYALGGEARAARLVALAVVAVLTVVVLRGITRTARLARVLLASTLASLLIALAVILAFTRSWQSPVAGIGAASPYGVLQSAGLLFFAFAGYARIATLGEEVIDPARTIPRAITRALLAAIVLYAVVALTLLVTIGPEGIASTALPLLAAAQAADVSWLGIVVRAGATLASLGALLALLTGVGRTAFAMARNADLPRGLAAVDARTSVPTVAQLAIAAAVALLVLLTDLRHAIGFSSFGVLAYYAVANLAALTQDDAHRLWPRWVPAGGLVGCLLLSITLPIGSVVAGVLVLAVGLLGRRVFAPPH
ncbi:MAG: APC family permease [Dermatophilaceae bacterium]